MITKFFALISISLLLGLPVFSQENKTINKILTDINELINPGTELDAKKGALIFSVYRNGDLRRESTIFINEVDINKIHYSTESMNLTLVCLQEDCAEQKIYGNNKSKKFSSQVRVKIADTLKGKEAENLLKIMLSEMNTESVVRLESKSNFIELSPHMISTMIDQAFYLNLSLAYEYINTKERLGYKVFGIYSPKYKSTEIGTALKIYLGKNKANIFNFGGLHLGTASLRYYTGPEVIYYTKNEYDFAAFRLQNGISFQSKNHINATLHTSMGAKNIIRSDETVVKNGETSFSWGLYFYLGWRF